MDFINKIKDEPTVIVSHANELFSCVLTTVDEFLKNFSTWQIVFLSVITTLFVKYLINSYYEIETNIFEHFKKCFFTLSKKIPFVKSKIKEELSKTQKSLENEILKSNKGFDYVRELPAKGLKFDEVNAQIDLYLKLNDNKWRDGSLSGGVFYIDDDLHELTADVYKKFSFSNMLHATVFPDVRKMEAEVVRMTCNMFNGNDETCGTMTSGGTESILLACKAYRELAYKNGIKNPEMVIPDTAHPAFDKAGHYFKIRIIHVPVDPETKRAKSKQMEKYINKNTCMLVASAPSFPHGVIDPVEDIAKLGIKYRIPVHVDSCVGGFLIPFMEEAGFKIPYKIDFRVPGVTSISCDTHKYGYTPKGSSLVLYRNSNYRENQYYSYADWPGGIYASPTIAGTRSGTPIAATWATMMYLGREGYVNATRDVVKTARYIADEIKKIKELKLLGNCDVSVVSFGSDQFYVLKLIDELSHDWHLNALQNPPGMQIAVTKIHTKPGIAERFVNDLKKAVSNVMAKPDRKLGEMAQIYCTSQSIPDRSLIQEVSNMYLNACYTTKKASTFENGKH